MSKKILAMSLAACMAVPFMAGCQSGGSSASGDKIIIGGIGPLTGDAASYGISVKNG